MVTRKLATSRKALIVAVAAGALAQAAAAAEVVVAVHGDATAAQGDAHATELAMRLAENTRSASQAIKADVERDITLIRAARPQLALKDVATQG